MSPSTLANRTEWLGVQLQKWKPAAVALMFDTYAQRQSPTLLDLFESINYHQKTGVTRLLRRLSYCKVFEDGRNCDTLVFFPYAFLKSEVFF